MRLQADRIAAPMCGSALAPICRAQLRIEGSPAGQAGRRTHVGKVIHSDSTRPPVAAPVHRSFRRRRRGARARGPHALSRSRDALKVGFISPRTGPLAGFGETDGYVLDVVRKALADGFDAAGKKFAVEILDQDTQSDPSRAGQLAKDLINNQAIDLMLAVSTPETINPVADACEAAGVPCLSTVMPWEAWYFGRGAKPGEPSPFKWTYHFGFGVARVLQGLRLAVEADRDQQEGRRHVSQRRRRQRHPRQPRAAARQGRLHHRRSGRLRDRHRRLFRADRAVQAGRRRDLQHLPDPAGFRRLLAPGGAAGTDQADQDRADRQDRAVPVRTSRRSAISATTSPAPATGTRPSPTSRR